MTPAYDKYLNIFEDYLNKTLKVLIKDVPNPLDKAMVYAVTDGGKRVRPVLCLAVADFLGVDVNFVLNYALAIELIHSY